MPYQKEAHPGWDRVVPRRAFFRSAAAAAASAGAWGLAAAGEASAATVSNWKIQTAWEEGTLGFAQFQRFCHRVTQMCDGKLRLEPVAPGIVVQTSELFDAVKQNILDAMHGFTMDWRRKLPLSWFLSAYPLGMDRPDLWETWFDALDGRELCREAFGAHQMVFLGPIHTPPRLIQARAPIRSFGDFKGKKIQIQPGMGADLFRAAGAAPVHLPDDKIYDALKQGTIDAVDTVSAAAAYNRGFGELAKFLIVGPPGTPSLHRPSDLMGLVVNQRRWNALSPSLQWILEAAVKQHSWDQFTAFQKADLEAIERMEQDQGLEVIRLDLLDVDAFRKLAPEIWVSYARRSSQSLKAFRSQLSFMKSAKAGLLPPGDLVDSKGQKLDV